MSRGRWGGARTGPEYPRRPLLAGMGVAQAYCTDMPRRALPSIVRRGVHDHFC